MNRHFSFIFFCFIVCVLSVQAQTYQSWQTSSSKSKYFSASSSSNMKSGTSSSSAKITLDPETYYQSVEGFGWMLTEATGKMMMQMSQSDRTNLLKELYSPTGTCRSTVVRIALGACDLSEWSYSYCDTKDESLNSFSLNGPDKDYLIPILKEIVSINPNIYIMAAPWSAPKWMKTINNWSGGRLNKDYYATYAKYFLKYLQAMDAEGIHVNAVSIQNEPENGGNNPSMIYNKEEMYEFAEKHLGPTLANNGYQDVKIIGFDHNCDNTTFPIHVAKSKYVSGTAFHLYGGNISAMKTVYKQSKKDVYFTEQYTGKGGDFGGDFKWHMQEVVIGSMTNYGRTCIEWNLASDPNCNMHTEGGCNSCLGALTLNNGSISGRNVSYYIIAQGSRVVQRGARRIASSGGDGLNHVAFVNPDGSLGLIIYNDGGDRTLDVVYKNHYCTVTACGNGATSVLLSGVGAECPSVDAEPTKDPSVTIHITSAPAGTDSIYLIGSWGSSWKLNENIPCTRQADGSWIGLVPETDPFEYKCWNRWKVNGQETWDYEEAIDNKGTKRPNNRTADYNKSKTETIQVLYWRKQAPNTTSLEGNRIEKGYTKTIQNGQLFILREGKAYNAQGQIMQ